MKTKLSIEVEDVQVTGEIIERCAYSISVEILTPFHGLIKDTEMEKFSTRFRNFMGEYGDEKARKLLRELYDFCLNIDQNTEYVKKRTAWMLAERDKIRANMEPINENQRTFKKMFSTGELTEKEYKNELLKLREIKKPHLQKISDLNIPSVNILRYIKRNYGEYSV